MLYMDYTEIPTSVFILSLCFGTFNVIRFSFVFYVVHARSSVCVLTSCFVL